MGFLNRDIISIQDFNRQEINYILQVGLLLEWAFSSGYRRNFIAG